MLAQGKLLRNVLIMNMDTQLESISESMYGKEIAALNAEEKIRVFFEYDCIDEIGDVHVR